MKRPSYNPFTCSLKIWNDIKHIKSYVVSEKCIRLKTKYSRPRNKLPSKPINDTHYSFFWLLVRHFHIHTHFIICFCSITCVYLLKAFKRERSHCTWKYMKKYAFHVKVKRNPDIFAVHTFNYLCLAANEMHLNGRG